MELLNEGHAQHPPAKLSKRRVRWLTAPFKTGVQTGEKLGERIAPRNSEKTVEKHAEGRNSHLQIKNAGN